MSEPTISYKRRQWMGLAPRAESVFISVIERCFSEGRTAAHANKLLTACPYYQHLQALEWRWWTRGYTYSARLFRALEAEHELVRLKDAVAALTREGTL